MKSYAGRILAVLGLAAAAAAAVSAQEAESRTTVPFAFTVGDATLPRGTYHVTRLPGQLAAFQIRSLTGGAVVLSQPSGPDAQDGTPRLVFHRYGDAHFLREVRLPGNMGFELPASRAERHAAERSASGARGEVVVLRASTR